MLSFFHPAWLFRTGRNGTQLLISAPLYTLCLTDNLIYTGSQVWQLWTLLVSSQIAMVTIRKVDNYQGAKWNQQY